MNRRRLCFGSFNEPSAADPSPRTCTVAGVDHPLAEAVLEPPLAPGLRGISGEPRGRDLSPVPRARSCRAVCSGRPHPPAPRRSGSFLGLLELAGRLPALPLGQDQGRADRTSGADQGLRCHRSPARSRSPLELGARTVIRDLFSRQRAYACAGARAGVRRRHFDVPPTPGGVAVLGRDQTRERPRSAPALNRNNIHARPRGPHRGKPCPGK
jgi:hypothetical protein